MVTIWSWSHYTPQADVVPDEDWILEFWAMDRFDDDCAVDGAEVNGEFVAADAVRQTPEYQALDAERDAEQWRTQSIQVVLEVKHPITNDWAAARRVEPDQAAEARRDLEGLYGAGRVRQR